MEILNYDLNAAHIPNFICGHQLASYSSSLVGIPIIGNENELQQVANHFGVNVSTIERLVRRLRETGRLADRSRSRGPRVTSQRHYRAIRHAPLRNRHITAIKIALLKYRMLS